MFEGVCLKTASSSRVGKQVMELEVGNDRERWFVVESQWSWVSSWAVCSPCEDREQGRDRICLKSQCGGRADGRIAMVACDTCKPTEFGSEGQEARTKHVSFCPFIFSLQILKPVSCRSHLDGFCNEGGSSQYCLGRCLVATPLQR